MTRFKNFIPAKLYCPKNAQWFVYYSVHCFVDNSMKVYRIYKNLNKKNISQYKREITASQIISEINEKLKNGWNPLDDTTYFSHISSIQSKTNAKNNSLNYFINEYLKNHQKNLRHKSYKTYQSKLRIFVKFCQNNGVNTIHQVNSKVLNDFFNGLQKKSPSTYNSYYTTLLLVFKDKKLFDGIKKLKTQPKPAKRLTDKDLILLFEYLKINDTLLLCFCRFVFYCFIRPHGELRFLQRSWINYEDMSVTIPGEYSKNHKTQILPIPINDFSIQLEDYKDHHPDHFIFSLDPKKTMGAKYWQERFKRHQKNINISREVTLYSLKHTGAIKLLESGASVMDIKQQMRHHSLDETEKYLRQMQVLENKRIRFNNLNF